MKRHSNIYSFIILCCLVATVATTSLHAETKDSLGWKRHGVLGLNVTQVSLNNWAGGGQNNIAVGGLFSYIATLVDSNTVWVTTIDAGYGQTKLGKQSFRKSDDKFNIASKFSYKATSTLSYSVLFDLRTQLTEGLSYNDSGAATARISNIFAPANILVGIGMTYVPAEYLSITLAPVSNRLLIVADDSLNKHRAFGVDSGKTIKSDLGALLQVSFKKDIMKNVTLDSKLSSFAPYAEITHNLVNWNTLLTMKVNEYLSANFALDVIYDHHTDVQRDDGTHGPSTQIRDVIGIGFGYKF